MLTKLISQYLASHRRLIVPGLGAFIVKESEGKVLFSELLKGDDGLLRSLLAERGLSEIEVAAMIDRFVFEVKHETKEMAGEYVMAGFGVFSRAENGKLSFVFNDAQIEEVDAPAEEQEDEQIAVELVEEPIVEVSEERVEEAVVSEPRVQELIQPQTPKSIEVEEFSVEGGSKYSKAKIKELYSRPQSFRENDPEVEDLEYSKRQKPLNGYTYVNNGSKRNGVDKIVIFGVAAAVMALCVICYGFYVTHIDDITNTFIEWGWMDDPAAEPESEVSVEVSEEPSVEVVE